jgi:Protein of unknown function (DUF4232)
MNVNPSRRTATGIAGASLLALLTLIALTATALGDAHHASAAYLTRAAAPQRAAQPAASSPAAPCRTAALTVAWTRTEGAAGNVYVSFRFTHHGAPTCTLRGYPHVLLFGDDGRPVTSADGRDGEAVTTVRLTRNGTAEFFLRYPSAGVLECTPRSARWVLIRPPQNSLPLLTKVPEPLSVCPGTVRRSPVAAHV